MVKVAMIICSFVQEPVFKIFQQVEISSGLHTFLGKILGPYLLAGRPFFRLPKTLKCFASLCSTFIYCRFKSEKLSIDWQLNAIPKRLSAQIKQEGK
jgi:hypothetical protein